MTGATAAMIGRAAMGNPWMLTRTEHYLKPGIAPRSECGKED